MRAIVKSLSYFTEISCTGDLTEDFFFFGKFDFILFSEMSYNVFKWLKGKSKKKSEIFHVKKLFVRTSII